MIFIYFILFDFLGTNTTTTNTRAHWTAEAIDNFEAKFQGYLVHQRGFPSNLFLSKF